MAERCASNEIPNAYAAAKIQECVELGVSVRHIQYYLDKYNSVEAAAHASECAHSIREEAQVDAKATSVKVVFVERGGAAVAEKAASKAIVKIEREKAKKMKNIINLADDEAHAAYQAGLEAGAEEARQQFLEEISSKSFEVNAYKSEALERDSSMKRMERELASERAKSREAEVEARAAEARANIERARLEQSQKRAHAFEKRIADIRRSSERATGRAATSPSDEVTWCAAEVEEMEQQIGELTEQVRKFKQMEREYQRNQSVACRHSSRSDLLLQSSRGVEGEDEHDSPGWANSRSFGCCSSERRALGSGRGASERRQGHRSAHLGARLSPLYSRCGHGQVVGTPHGAHRALGVRCL